MRKQTLLFIFALFIANNGISLLAQGLNFSGILDSSVSLSIIDDEVSLGIEEYANLRFQARLRENGTFYGAVNLLAAAGDYAKAAAPAAGLSVFSQNYAAVIELERLYFRLNFEKTDLDGGLLRLPFGYGQVWGSSDFLNPKNPMIPDARPRAVLGAGLSFYPNNEIKLLGFGTAPRNPFSQGVNGWLAGILAERHFDKASVQALYSFETPKDGSKNGIHRFGFSLKTDLIAGIVIDALYTYNHEAKTGLDGLSFSIGADYSFFDGKMFVLAEYLYNGEASSTSSAYGGYFLNRHYLYTGAVWRFNDFTNMNAAFILSFDEFSFTPIITLNHDLFQGVVLTVSSQMPMNSDTFSGGGIFIIVNAVKLRLRF